jgi:hypothetical protein
VIPPPKIGISPISTSGKVDIQFDEDMLVPSTIKQSDYQKVFDVYVVSALDNSIAYAGTSRNGRLLVGDDPTEAENLLFEVKVLKHEKRDIQVKIEFVNPSAVSAYGTDLLSFKIKDLQFFKSASTGLPLDAEKSFPSGRPQVVRQLPSIIGDEGTAA